MSVSISRLPLISRAIYAGGLIGHAVMDEVGGVLGKAEQYFGRTLTAGGLAIIALGAIAAAAKSLWANFLGPAYKLYAKSGISWEIVANIGAGLFLLGLFFMLIGGFIRDKKEKVAFQDTLRLLDEAERVALKTDETSARTLLVAKEADERIAAANLLIEATTLMLRSQGTIGQEKAEQILSLLNSEQ